MTIQPRGKRAGYTLLEVMLASFIAVGLMGGLFVALDSCLQQMQAGREAVEQSSLSRAIFIRIGNDLTPSLAPTQPVPSSGGTSNGAGAASPTSMTTTATTTGQLNFQIGVRGESNQVAIYQTRLTRGVVNPADDGNGNQNPYASDVRRICYFLTAKGLVRQEILMVTSEQVDELPVDVDENSKILAGEIQDFEVRYFDGTNWTDSWDGSTPGPDGKTPQGPPRAIEFTVAIAMSGTDQTKTFKHVIAFPAAPGSAATQ